MLSSPYDAAYVSVSLLSRKGRIAIELRQACRKPLDQLVDESVSPCCLIPDILSSNPFSDSNTVSRAWRNHHGANLSGSLDALTFD